MANELELLQGLRTDVEALQYDDYDNLDAYRRRTDMLARRIFGENSKYVEDIPHIRFSPSITFGGMTDADYIPSWNSGRAELVNLIDTMIEELSLFGSPSEGNTESNVARAEKLMEQSVFIVHGRDEEMKQSVARALEKLGIEAIILHEQPNKGRTVIEKFLDYGEIASFAIVLLSPDDLAFEKDDEPKDAKFRARQNVVLELGFFLGKLGRDRVVAIHREADRFEMPTDYSGVLFVPYDRRGTWQFEMVRELKEAGYQADANLLA